jgi:FlaA1/EpsC-like NDP-sugar epimerase
LVVGQDSPSGVFELINTYIKREESGWLRINNLLENKLIGIDEVVVWGGSLHTSQLLSNTTALCNVRIKFIIDSDPQKYGLDIEGYEIRGFKSLNSEDGAYAIVISSKAYEDEIFSFLKKELKASAKIIRLYK